MSPMRESMRCLNFNHIMLNYKRLDWHLLPGSTQWRGKSPAI